jgi:hypothetical protein
MSQESLVYLINFVIGAILAVLLTHHWRLAGRESSLGYWMVAAWTMVAADVLFALRPAMPFWVGRMVPTLMVTVGQVVLLLWTMRRAGRGGDARLGATIVAVHAFALAGFLAMGGISGWRTVFNGLLWGGLSIAAYAYLRHGTEATRGRLTIPAYVFLAHGCFHMLRTLLALLVMAQGDGVGVPWLQVIGDVEVSFFMVALFVSLLVEHLHLRNVELRAALDDVQLLSGLLPICSWCRKVRTDDGYWDEIGHYFATHRQVKFTHGICEDCSAEQLEGEAEPAGA